MEFKRLQIKTVEGWGSFGKIFVLQKKIHLKKNESINITRYSKLLIAEV